MNYQDKYFKYKKKYLNLKQEILGGTHSANVSGPTLKLIAVSGMSIILIYTLRQLKLALI